MSTDARNDGLIDAFLFDGHGGARVLDWDGIDAWRADAGMLWLHVDYANPAVRQWLDTKSGIDDVILSALTDPDPRPRAIAYGDKLQLIVRGMNNNVGSAPENMISVRAWVEPRRVITMRHRASTSVKQLVSELKQGEGPRNAADLTVQLAERIVDHVVARVDRLGDAVAACEDQVLGGDAGDLRATLADHRRNAIALRRYLGPQRDALTKLASINVPWLEPNHRARLAEVADQLTRTVEELDAARDRAAVTQEELGSRVAEATNKRLYVLSIFTSVFLPLGFVCSLLGVNVGGVPLQKSDWAFWALCGVFALYIYVQLWLFKKRGWL
ncbi:MAG TPA: zinc transporter ZntB [Kofleriaceae bacterium]|nr:zinc transporter ZntB [Kofleriaceae bacterium]